MADETEQDGSGRGVTAWLLATRGLHEAEGMGR
jgi:hypothetical protein